MGDSLLKNDAKTIVFDTDSAQQPDSLEVFAGFLKRNMKKVRLTSTGVHRPNLIMEGVRIEPCLLAGRISITVTQDTRSASESITRDEAKHLISVLQSLVEGAN